MSSAIYSQIVLVIINVVTTPVVLEFPQVIKVPLYGCNIPQNFSIPNAPYYDLSLNFVYDKIAHPQNQFWIDSEFSQDIITYDVNLTYQYVSFCTSANFSSTVEEIKITYQLSGSNRASYSLKYEDLTILFLYKDTTIEPQLLISLKSTTSTKAEFQINIVTDGVMYWHIYVNSTTSTLSIREIKNLIKTHEQIIQTQSSHLSYMRNSELDQRVGMQIYYWTEDNGLLLDSLVPQTAYTLCAWFENEYKKVIPEPSCVNFTTKNWQPMAQIQVKLSRLTFPVDRNKLLCLLTSKIQTSNLNVVDQEGQSCNIFDQPIKYYMSYKGT